MSYTQERFALTTLSAALMVVFGPVMAAEMDEELKQIAVPSSSVSLGVGVWSDDRPQKGAFDGMRDDGAYLLLDADINMRNDATGTWTTLKATDLGLDSREIGVEYNVQGNWGVTLDYSKAPRLYPYTVNTSLIGLGTTEQVVGPTIATGALTGSNVQLGLEREKFGIGFHKNLQAFLPGLEFKVNFTNENKEGLRHWSRFAAVEFMAEPIDWTTRQLDATLNYSGKKLQLSGGYVGSWFEENGYNLICARTSAVSCTDTVGSPFAGGLQNPSFLSLPFDNQAHQVFLSGAYRFTPTTQGTFKASYTRATVDEAIPTASVSAGTVFTYWNAPTHFDGEVNTTLLQLGLTARPMPKLNVLANFRYHDVDDETPRYELVGTNPAPGAATSHGTPLSYSTMSGKLEGTYSLPLGYSVIAGIDYSSQDRTVPVGVIAAGRDTERYVPFRADLDEITYRLQLRKSLSETLNGSIAYLRSDRDGSDFSIARAANVDQIAPLHIADRERDKVRLTVDWAPIDALGVQLNFETSKDDYGNSATRPHGIHEGKANVYSLDVSYRLNKDWQTSAWFSHSINDIYQTGRGPQDPGSSPAVYGTKDADQQDTGNAVGAGLTGKVTAKTKVGMDVTWSKDKSEISQRYWNNAGAQQSVTQVPNITSTSTRIKLFAEYALQKNADLRLDLIHERWKSDDWTWIYSNGSNFQYGTTTDGTTVIVDPKQNASFVGVRYTYKFN